MLAAACPKVGSQSVKAIIDILSKNLITTRMQPGGNMSLRHKMPHGKLLGVEGSAEGYIPLLELTVRLCETLGNSASIVLR